MNDRTATATKPEHRQPADNLGHPLNLPREDLQVAREPHRHERWLIAKLSRRIQDS